MALITSDCVGPNQNGGAYMGICGSFSHEVSSCCRTAISSICGRETPARQGVAPRRTRDAAPEKRQRNARETPEKRSTCLQHPLARSPATERQRASRRPDPARRRLRQPQPEAIRATALADSPYLRHGLWCTHCRGPCSSRRRRRRPLVGCAWPLDCCQSLQCWRSQCSAWGRKAQRSRGERRLRGERREEKTGQRFRREERG